MRAAAENRGLTEVFLPMSQQITHAAAENRGLTEIFYVCELSIRVTLASSVTKKMLRKAH